MSGIQTIAEPGVEPVTAAEVRAQVRLDDDTDDAVVTSIIIAARNWAENYTGRVFINRTMRMWLDGTPAHTERLSEGIRTAPYMVNNVGYVEIGASPVVSVESIKYFDDADTEYTWDSSNYYADIVRDPARIVLRDGGTFPTDLRRANGLQINFTAGYGASRNTIPEALRMAVLQYSAFLYEHRGDFERFPAPTPPAVVRTLLQPYKVIRFGSTPYQTMFKASIG